MVQRLHKAAEEGDLVELQAALQGLTGRQVDARNGEGQAALHLAAGQGHAEAVKLLLAAGASVTRTQEADERTALHVAAEEGHTEVARLLLAAGSSVHATDYDDAQPLHCAAYYGDAAMVELLLSAGAKAGTKNASGQTPLMVAAEMSSSQWAGRACDYAAVTRLMLTSLPPRSASSAANDSNELLPEAAPAAATELRQQPSSVPAGGTDACGESPLHAAVRAGDAAVVATLCQSPAATMWVNAQSLPGSGGCSPLHLAAAAGHCDLTGLLLGAGADPNAREASGMTPLHVTVRALQAAVVEVLLAHQAVEPSAPDAVGLTPLHLAAQQTEPPAVQVAAALLAAGADACAAGNVQRVTPLHMAAASGASAVAEALLHAGADGALTDAAGNTPLHVAAARGHGAVVRALLQAQSCSVAAANAQGRTAADLARAAGHTTLAHVLDERLGEKLLGASRAE